MAFIDGTVVNVALPTLQANLDATVQDVQWVVEAYVLFLAALLLVGGSLGARPLDRQALLPVMTPCRPDSLSIQEEEPTCSKQKLQ
jgi:MFS family permease